MKKLLATILSLAILGMTALPAAAQKRNRAYVRSVSSNQRIVNRNQIYRNNAYPNTVYNDDNYYGDRSVWETSRDKITTAGGAVGGAILGGLIGGKKGAIIGAITGGAGAAVYTYKIRDKNGRY